MCVCACDSVRVILQVCVRERLHVRERVSVCEHGNECERCLWHHVTVI